MNLSVVFRCVFLCALWVATPVIVNADDAPAAPDPTASATVAKTGTQYFFSIDVDPRYQIVGAGPLTPEMAAQSDCYALTYDASGKLQRVEFQRAGVAMADSYSLFQVARVDFEYAPGIERRWFRDAAGRPVRDNLDVYGEELALDSAGFVKSVTNLKASGATTRDNNDVLKYVRTVDDKGRVIRLRRIGLLGTDIIDGGGFFETRSIYDDQDRRIEYGNYDAQGHLLGNKDYVALIRTTYSTAPDSGQIVTENYLNSSGLPTEEQSTGIHRRVRTYDPRGLLTSESFYDITNTPTIDREKGIHEKFCVYDDHGNLLTEQYLGLDGRQRNVRTDGYSEIAYKYDDKNRVIEREFLGDDGTPQVLLSIGAAIIRQEYDNQGNMIRRQFFNGEGQPVNHRIYGAPAIRIEVKGDTTLVSLRDADDHLKENPVGGYAAFSYKPAIDEPLTPTNLYYDRDGNPMRRLRVFVINPHLHALATTPLMQISARCGASAVGLGALLAVFISLTKGRCVRQRKIYVPHHQERFLGWLALFLIGEGLIRFFLTIYWAWVGYQNGKMGPGVYLFEVFFILFFFYRLLRINYTMRVLNVRREDVIRWIREFFKKNNFQAERIESLGTFNSHALRVRVRYFAQKAHAYVSFSRYRTGGKEAAKGIRQYIRKEAAVSEGPPSGFLLSCYYPSVAICYLLLSLTAFYTLWQLVK